MGRRHARLHRKNRNRWKNAVTEHAPIGAGNGRWPRIAVGFTLASLASGYTLAFLLLVPVGLLIPHILLIVGFVSFVGIALLALLPAVYLIALAEARSWRSPAFYAVAGLAIALIWAGVLPPVMSPGAMAAGRWAVDFLDLAPRLGLSGLVGGVVYWWFAARTVRKEQPGLKREAI